MTAALLNWRVWAVVCIAVALAASHWRAYTRGQISVQTEWDADKLAQAKAGAAALAQVAATAKTLQAQADTLRRTKNAQIDRLNADLAAALDSLRQRPERPGASDMPSDPAAGPATGCTGAQLYRPDAGFLAREAARGQRILAELAECQADHQSAREALSGDLKISDER